MKRTASFALSAASLAAALVGSLTVAGPAFADSAADCSESQPASVYTDGLAHYAGACAGDAYLQVNELRLLTGGVVPLEGATGVPEIDETVAALRGSGDLNATQCNAGYGDAVKVYTDALAHVLGACDPYGNQVQVNEIAGALTARNNLVEVSTGIAVVGIQTRAENGSSATVVNPKVTVTPR